MIRSGSDVGQEWEYHKYGEDIGKSSLSSYGYSLLLLLFDQPVQVCFLKRFNPAIENFAKEMCTRLYLQNIRKYHIMSKM